MLGVAWDHGNSDQGASGGRQMLSLRSHSLITGAIFAGLLAIGWGGNLLDGLGLLPHDWTIQIAVLALMLGLCVALAFSAVPLMVLIVLGFQARIGNAGVPVIRTLIAHQRTIVFVLWGLMAAGLLIAIPAVILGGAFEAIEFQR
jgi:hypothetical protein